MPTAINKLSAGGALSAIRAEIPVVGCVGSHEGTEMQAQMTEIPETGARVVMSEWSRFQSCLSTIEEA